MLATISNPPDDELLPRLGNRQGEPGRPAHTTTRCIGVRGRVSPMVEHSSADLKVIGLIPGLVSHRDHQL